MGLFNNKKKESYFEKIEELPVNLKKEVHRMIDITPKIFNINLKNGKDIATKIDEIVGNILETNIFPKEYSDIGDVAIALGLYYGQAICDYYKWSWKYLNEIISIVSPDNNYSIQPMHYMHKILTKNNIGLDGQNDNTVLLLFNMLDNIDSRPSEWKYTPLS